MGQYIIEIVIDADSKAEAQDIQRKIDHVGPIKASVVRSGFKAYDSNKVLIAECGQLAKEGKKTAMMAKLGTALIKGSIKI